MGRPIGAVSTGFYALDGRPDENNLNENTFSTDIRKVFRIQIQISFKNVLTLRV